jgi:hypothetical protein
MTPANDSATELLRHALATLAYRTSKTLRDAPPEFAGFAGAAPQTPVKILAHMGDLFGWALTIVDGHEKWRASEPLPWNREVARFFAALEAFDRRLAAGVPSQVPLAQLFQGPVADALTHTGQLAMLRRLAGCPMPGENYFAAEIVTGRAGADQAEPRVKFD